MRILATVVYNSMAGEMKVAHCASKWYRHAYCCSLLHKMSVPTDIATCTLIWRLCRRQQRWLNWNVSAITTAPPVPSYTKILNLFLMLSTLDRCNQSIIYIVWHTRFAFNAFCFIFTSTTWRNFSFFKFLVILNYKCEFITNCKSTKTSSYLTL